MPAGTALAADGDAPSSPVGEASYELWGLTGRLVLTVEIAGGRITQAVWPAT